MKTHYELLGIEPTASPENIRASYLRAIAFYHPDRNKSKDAIEMTQLLNEAYDTLKDPRKKNDYDSMLLTRLLTGDPQQTPPQEPEPPRKEPELPKQEPEPPTTGKHELLTRWGIIISVVSSIAIVIILFFPI